MTRKGLFCTAFFCLATCGYGGLAQALGQNGVSSNVSVLASESVLLQESGATTASLAIPGPGDLFITLTDLQFPTSFSSLQYAVSNVAGVMVAPTAAGTTTTLDLTAPMTLYANVFATVGASGAGLYNLTATFVSAVPLPDSLGLFASGILLALLGHCRTSRPRVPRSMTVDVCDRTGSIAASA